LIDVLSGPGDNNYFRINETGWNFSTFYSEKKSYIDSNKASIFVVSIVRGAELEVRP